MKSPAHLSLFGFILFSAAFFSGVHAHADPSSPLPRVLILGDSISIHYTDEVRKALETHAAVARPMKSNGRPENCGSTVYGLEHLDRWLGEEKWDVIHFNWGLHDLKHMNRTDKNPKGEKQVSLEDYEKNLDAIVERLGKTGAKLIFATTTPVPPGLTTPLRFPEDVVRYNEAALRVMKKHGVAVNDLYGFAKPRLKEIQRPRNVHFTEEGSALIAQEVARHIRKALGGE